MARRRKGQPIHGWLNLDKPLGLSSSQAVGKVKRLLDAQKAGHGGTLDPLATGVLPIALGEATKTSAYILDGDKGYRFTVRWGEARATDDAEGAVVATSDVRPTEDEIRAALPQFVGAIAQVPPAYSAIKVAGERAYALARAGEGPALEPRAVRIDRLALVEVPDPDHATFEVDCGKGTYVRSLARDVAAALGTHGYVSALCRTRTGPFGLETAISLDALDAACHKGAALSHLLPVSDALDDIPAVPLTGPQADRLRGGQRVRIVPATADPLGIEGLVLATHAGQPVALADLSAGELQPRRVFNL